METSLFFYLALSLILTPILYYFLFYDPKFREPTTSSPPSYAVIGCLISFYQNRHRLLSWYTDLLSSSPTQTVVINRLGARKTIVTANPKNVEYILKTNFVNFPKGQPFTEILNDFLGCGIFNVDGDLWHAQRKLASHQFTSRSLKEHVEITVKEAVKTKLLPLLDSLVDVEGVDLQEVLRRFGFDVVCKLSLGFDPCCLGDQDSLNKVVPILTAFDTAAEISARRAATPVAATWKFKKLFGVGSEQVLKNCVKTIHDYIENIVHERKKNITSTFYENKDLLSRMIVSGVSEDMIRDMMISFIMAGKDTTSAAMTWLFYAISQHAHVEKHLLNEIVSHFNDEQCDNLQEMKYLHACICETMRLYPPVAWDSKHAVEADVLPDGTKVMAGDRVTYFPYGMGRMESIWGENRLEFSPKRWFDSEPDGQPDENLELLKEVSPYKYPVFHAGPRVCLGKNMAIVQMSYVVASIVNRFEIRPVRTGFEAVYLPLLTAHMHGGFKVLIRSRPV